MSFLPPSTTETYQFKVYQPSLMDQLTQDAVASDYGHVEPQRFDPGKQRLHWIRAAIGLGVVGLVLGTAVAQTKSASPAIDKQRAALITQINKAEDEVDKLEADIAQLESDLADVQAKQLGVQGAALAEQVTTLELMAGYSDVRGQGMSVTLTDAEKPSASTGQVEQVFDVDLQMVVNGLWMAGATAIDINGQRLSPRTAIRGAGTAITVNYRPLRPPYVVSAIGDRGGLMRGFQASAAMTGLEDLQKDYGIGFSMKEEDSLKMSAAVFRAPDHAVPMAEAPSPAAPSPRTAPNGKPKGAPGTASDPSPNSSSEPSSEDTPTGDNVSGVQQ